MAEICHVRRFDHSKEKTVISLESNERNHICRDSYLREETLLCWHRKNKCGTFPCLVEHLAHEQRMITETIIIIYQ